MKLTLERINKANGYTEGKLYANGAPVCNTLEPTDRGLLQGMTLAEIKAKKISGKTAIPTGTYAVTLTNSPRFGRVLPLINGTVGFAGVRIHRGNTKKDTSGCILPGDYNSPGVLVHSTKYEVQIIDMLRAAESRGEKNTLTIQ